MEQLCLLSKEKLQRKYKQIPSEQVVLTGERMEHILERHPDDVLIFKQFGTITIQDPDIILNDSKNADTVMYIRAIEESNLNVIVKLALSTEENKKSSVMTACRLGAKTLKRLKKKNEVLYIRE